MESIQYIQAYGHNQDDLLKFKVSVRMEIKGDLSDFELGMGVGASLLMFQKLTTSWANKEWPRKEKISSEWQFFG